MDEPTGNLDRRTALGVHQLMQELSESFNTSFVVVTHDEALAATLERKLSLVAGKLVDEH
jgi:lipoprotein-releasing system ATP-binding protein